jgi:hypothetical protein
MAIAVIVDKRATTAPRFSRAGYSRLLAHIAERAVTVVAIQNIFSVIGNI